MSEKKYADQNKGLNGNQLKLIAVVSMFIDHAAFVLLGHGLLQQISVNEARYLMWRDIYYAMRCIGRIAFPIYAFLLVEGFFHTRNWCKYALRLGVFAFISEFPFDLMVFPHYFSSPHERTSLWEMQNVFFTLLIGLLTMKAMDTADKRFSGKPQTALFFRLGIIAAGAFLAWMLKTDYDFTGIMLIALLFLFHHDRPRQCMAGFVWLFAASGSWRYLLGIAAAFLLIYLYNGERGKIERKYAFYLFYPIHILFLYGIYVMVFLD